MGQAHAFIEILEQKIRNSLETEGYPTHDQSGIGVEPAHLSFLIGSINPLRVSKKLSQSTYPKPVANPRKPHKLSSAQAEAFVQLKDWGQFLDPGFTKNELKKCFRVLAKRLHPDHSKGDGQDFIQLKKHYECLMKIFIAPL